MSEYKVLARKYRPQKLSELIGQDVLVRTLTSAIEKDRIPHAFMLTGIRGVGKTSTARIIARSLLCSKSDDKKPTIEPCGECENCKAISDDNHVDVIEIDAASRTGVNDIREIIDQVSYAPVMGRYKIYIIDEVHMLSKSAFNALLKTLEEPPEHVKFIFATTEVRKIPVTIISRCMRFDLPRVSSELLKAHFKNVAEKENIEVEDEALSIIASESEGSVRDGLSLLDQAIAISEDDKVSGDSVSKMLGLSDKEKIYDLLDNIIVGKFEESISVLEEIYNNGTDAMLILKDLQQIIHNLCLFSVSPKLLKEKAVTETEAKRSEAILENANLRSLSRLWQILVRGMEEAKISQNSYMVVEMLILKACYAAGLPTPEEIMNRLEGNEEKVVELAEKKTPHKRELTQNSTDSKEISSVNELLSLLKEKDETLVASWLQDAKIVKFDNVKKVIEFSRELNTDLVTLKEFKKKLSDLSGINWSVDLNRNETHGKSINDELKEDVEKRKKEAINSVTVQNILKQFEGAEILSVNEIIE